MALVGFSMGGIVVMNTLCNLLSDVDGKGDGGRIENLAVATVYGDPTFRAAREWDAGSCEVDAVSNLLPMRCLKGTAAQWPHAKPRHGSLSGY